MMSRLLRLRHELGGLGLASLVLLAAVGAFHFAVLKPLEARNDELKSLVARQPPRAQTEQGTTADKVGAVYQFLRKDEQPTDWLAKLHRIRSANRVPLEAAEQPTPS